ncbi:MAG TPA: copper resistance protein CopC, partial [Frankiaceae bacterium]|nr:copper resistance protein CopC [Frankiaceae bacterium]
MAGGSTPATPAAAVAVTQVVVDLRPDLPDGTYVVTWRVVSADSHPVSGAYALGVGTAPDTSAAAASGRTGAGSPAVGYLAGVARAVGTGGLVLLVGGARNHRGTLMVFG